MRRTLFLLAVAALGMAAWALARYSGPASVSARLTPTHPAGVPAEHVPNAPAAPAVGE